MIARARWLLDTEIDGRVYRWSDGDVLVRTAAGLVVPYTAGLGELELAQGSDDEVEVEVVDSSCDWPVLAVELDGRAVTLRRWIEGTPLDAAEVYARGEAADVRWGSREEPASFVLAVVSGSDLGLGTSVPDTLARVDETTWPVSGGVLGTAGVSYPVIFGFPGFTGATLPECVVPVPIGQHGTVGTTRLVVAEDAGQPINVVRIRNDEAGTEADEAVVVQADLLGRPVRVATFTSSVLPHPGTPNTRVFAGYHPSGGGGPRDAYSVVAYLLERWGPETFDRSRLPEIRDVLAEYQVDTWIEQPLADPWAWIEGTLVRDLLLDVRTGAGGRYLVHRRFVPDGSRLVGSVSVDRGEAYRVSELSRSGAAINEFTALYRESRAGDYTARVILSGDPDVRPLLGSGTVPVATATQVVTTATTRRCRESLARYRRRQDPDGPVELDWSWDTGTVLRCLERRAECYAVPAILGTYEVDQGEDLVEGDEVALWDEAQGFRGRRALVDAPPVRADITTVALRIEP